MGDQLSDALTAVGLILTALRAGIAAYSVILSPGKAIEIGSGAWADNTDEENLELPMVKNLISASRGAQKGLILVVLGTGFQFLPVLARLCTSLTN
ncbi:MAG: hypothetical protein Q8O82_14690 [Pseudorhodobacter sp.]|nr:hypothetical protein [Pseudorhodobacter sp.]